MRVLAMLFGAILALAPWSRVHAQDRAVRFAITAVGDTTVTFEAGKMTWVVRTKQAIVVDPRRQDAMVARLKVLSVTSTGEATAMVTAQVGRITTEHVIIGTEPPVRWYRSTLLWMGTALGLAAGFAIGKA